MLRSGSICVSLLYNYLLSDSGEKGNNGLVNRHTKLERIADTFASYGGVLAKLSQILSFYNEKSEVFSDCKPYCQKETIEYLKNEYDTNKEFFKDIDDIDFNVFKSGSIGQVHLCKYKNNEDIIMKVQYVGLYEQFQSDIFILDNVAKYLFYFSDLSSAMTDIKTKLYEELDYTLEFNNQQKMFDLWNNHKYINIAKLIPELCTKNILTMEYISGSGIISFIENSTQEERNNIGMLIIEFIFTNFYKYGLFYPDIHYGNFLVKDNTQLYITDFGCLNKIEDHLLNNLINLHIAIKKEDEDEFYNIVKKIGILKDDISEESKIYMYKYFKIQYTPWLQDDEFEFTEEWNLFAVRKETELMKEWILPPNCVYLNKIPYGMYHLLTKLKVKGDFSKLFNKLIGI